MEMDGGWLSAEQLGHKLLQYGGMQARRCNYCKVRRRGGLCILVVVEIVGGGGDTGGGGELGGTIARCRGLRGDDVDANVGCQVHYNQISDILCYEVLDIPLPELQGLKTLKVAFHHATKDEVVIHSIRLPKNSTVGDVINDLKTKVELSHPNAELRLLEVFYHKIYKLFPPSEKIENINDQYWTLRAEEDIRYVAASIRISSFPQWLGASCTALTIFHLKTEFIYYRGVKLQLIVRCSLTNLASAFLVHVYRF